jgi:hypothetical protein
MQAGEAGQTTQKEDGEGEGGGAAAHYQPPWWVLDTSAQGGRLERARLAVHRTLLDATTAHEHCLPGAMKKLRIVR